MSAYAIKVPTASPQPLRRSLTLRSSGRATACHAWPSFHSGPCVPCRCAPLTSNVGQLKRPAALWAFCCSHGLNAVVSSGMLALPTSGLVSWPSNRAPTFVAAEVERHLKNLGATGLARTGNRLEFEHLPLRQLFHSFHVKNGSFEISCPGKSIQISYSASAPVLPVLVPFLLVALLMGAMAIQSGAPPENIAAVLVVAAVAFVFAVRAAAAFGLRSVALGVRAASASRSP